MSCNGLRIQKRKNQKIVIREFWIVQKIFVKGEKWGLRRKVTMNKVKGVFRGLKNCEKLMDEDTKSKLL